ncbi:hypothetical protein E2562_028090 [Oryza meyeriana var. granulata]|uniref:DUF3615 domain-containing protein n=2 Tax=Oryza meyeriana var. granulata TaxID=110450 RepID=A0A6G1C9E9_9ORYZ|nr:hypothetical protein E2562_028090 [Oryza meyeriana var. granulata]
MDGDAGDDPATGGRAGRGDVPFAGDDLATRRRPNQRGVHVSLEGGPVLGPVDFAVAELELLASLRRSESLARAAAAAQQSEKWCAEAGSKTHIRQSVLYSERKGRSRREQGGAQTPTLQAAVCAGDMGSGEHDSSTLGSSGLEEASPSLSEELSELEEYFRMHTFSSFKDAFRYVLSVQRAAFPGVPIAEDEILPQQFEDEAFELTTPDRSDPVRVPTTEASVDIVQNGNKWMGKEVMAAFETYIGKRDNLKDFEYKLDELCRQCFNVKNYNHIFHHFNFSVKTKAPGSTVWTAALYFAEVKTIFRHKVYFCCPLEPSENGMEFCLLT